MIKRTLYTAILALFVGGLAGVPLQAQTQKEGIPVGQNQRAPDRVGEPVTVRVTNNNCLDMRIYVMETTLGAALAARHRHVAEHGPLRDS